jgi:ribonuclease HI
LLIVWILWIQGKWIDMPPQSAPEDYVKLFTDGACSGNPGPGGWAFIMEHPASGRRVEHAGAEQHTTNNRMEIISALRGLTTLKRSCRVEIITDSQYLAKGIMEWLPGWRANGYKRREGKQLKPLQNEDLWRAVDEQLGRHEIKVTHVKGHAGHPENERCDKLAVSAYKRLMTGSLGPGQSEPWGEKSASRSPVNNQAYAPPAPTASNPAAEFTPAQLPQVEPEQNLYPTDFDPPEPVTSLATPAAKPKSARSKPAPRRPVAKLAPEVPPLVLEAPQPPKTATVRPKAKPSTKPTARKPKAAKSAPANEMPLRWDPDDEVV